MPRDGSPVKKTKQGNDQARPMLAGILGDYKKIPPIILIVLVLLVVTLIATLAYVLTKFQQYDAKLEAIGEITAPFKGKLVVLSLVSTFYFHIHLQPILVFFRL